MIHVRENFAVSTCSEVVVTDDHASIGADGLRHERTFAANGAKPLVLNICGFFACAGRADQHSKALRATIKPSLGVM